MNSPKLRAHDIPLLEHINEYQLTTHITAARDIFSDIYPTFPEATKAAGEAFTAMKRREYVRTLYLPGGTKCYLLTEKAREVIADISRIAVTSPGPQRLDLDLAVLWFGTMYEPKANRLTPTEVAELYPGFRPHQNVAHCLRVEDGAPVLYRMYLCAAETKRCQSHIGSLVKQVRQNGALANSNACSYRICVLTPTEQSAAALSSKGNLDEQLVSVASAATSETFHRNAMKYKKVLSSKEAA